MAKRKKGPIIVIAGCMFSGKTAELIRLIKRAKYARQKVQVFKHALDDRYLGVQQLSSHDGGRCEAIPVLTARLILELLESDTDVVAIDEGQFFDLQLPEICTLIANSGKQVIVAGLDTDFRGEPFGPMPILLAIAEEVIKLHAVCLVCGNDATRTQRLVDGKPASYNDPIIVVGATEKYEARCRECHKVQH